MAHTVTIGTRRQAERASTETLFRPVNGHSATRRIPYCTGKYTVNMRGREVTVRDEVVAIWSERRRDREGPYWALLCYVSE